MGEPRAGELLYVFSGVPAGKPGFQVQETGDYAPGVLVFHREQGLRPGAKGLTALKRGKFVARGLLHALQHHVAAVPVDAEGADPGAPLAFRPVAQPVLRLHRDMEALPGARQPGQRVHLQHRGEDFLVKRQGGLYDAGQPAGRPRVPYHRLDRAQGAGKLRRGDPVKIGQRLGFGGVFLGNAAAVRFQVAYRGRVHLGLAVSLAQRAGIGGGGGRRLVYPAAGGEAQPLDDRVNPVPVAEGVVQALEYKGRGAFTRDRTRR